MRYYVRLVFENRVMNPPFICGTITEAQQFKKRYEREGFEATIYEIELMNIDENENPSYLGGYVE